MEKMLRNFKNNKINLKTNTDEYQYAKECSWTPSSKDIQKLTQNRSKTQIQALKYINFLEV
jgi:hypothetical protein